MKNLPKPNKAYCNRIKPYRPLNILKGRVVTRSSRILSDTLVTSDNINQLSNYILAFQSIISFMRSCQSVILFIIYFHAFSQVGKCTKSILTSVGVQNSSHITLLHTYLSCCRTSYTLRFTKGRMAKF